MITIKVDSTRYFVATNEFNEFDDGLFQSFLEGDEFPVLAEAEFSIHDAFSEALCLLGA